MQFKDHALVHLGLIPHECRVRATNDWTFSGFQKYRGTDFLNVSHFYPNQYISTAFFKTSPLCLENNLRDLII